MNLDYLLSSVTETNFDSVGGNCEPGERRIDESKVIDAAIPIARVIRWRANQRASRLGNSSNIGRLCPRRCAIRNCRGIAI
jgi:hypothetical protein